MPPMDRVEVDVKPVFETMPPVIVVMVVETALLAMATVLSKVTRP
jgi:hypothetical protein